MTTDMPTNADVAHQLRRLAEVPGEGSHSVAVEISQVLQTMCGLAVDQIEHGQVDGPNHKDLLRLFVRHGRIAYDTDHQEHR